MATADPLAHFVGPDVLDPWFQDLVARDILPCKARREIMELLQGEDLRISVRVAGGVRALQPMHFATKEEEEQAREEYRAAVARHDYDAADDAIYGTSPPSGLIGPLGSEDWGHKVTLVIRGRRLLIEWRDPTFRPEHCSFAIVNPEVLDRLVVAASPAYASSAAKRKKEAQLKIAEAAKKIWPPDGIVLLDFGPADLMHAIEDLYKREAAAKGPKEKPRDPPSWSSCKRFLEDQRST